MKALNQLVEKLKSETGIAVQVFTLHGVPLAGASGADALMPPPDGYDDDGILAGETAVFAKAETLAAGNVVLGVACTGAAGVTLIKTLRFAVENARPIEVRTLPLEENLKRLMTGDGQISEELRLQLADMPRKLYMTVFFTKGGALKQRELYEYLQTLSERGDLFVTIDADTLVYFKKAGDEDDYRSAADFAAVMFDNIKEELRIELNIATGADIAAPDDIFESYTFAADANRLGRMLAPNIHVYPYKEYMIPRLLSESPRPLMQSYLDIMLPKLYRHVFSDSELMTTADEFLKNSLNISETSRNMYIHRNTLIYRLDKIENETGLNLRRFDDALLFRLIKTLHILAKTHL